MGDSLFSYTGMDNKTDIAQSPIFPGVNDHVFLVVHDPTGITFPRVFHSTCDDPVIVITEIDLYESRFRKHHSISPGTRYCRKSSHFRKAFYLGFLLSD